MNQTASTREHEMRFGDEERAYVFSVAMKYVRDHDEAADVTQEAMLLAWRYRDSFRGDSRFTTWLYRIAATTALMHLRKRRRQPARTLVQGGAHDEQEGLDRLAQLPSPASSPEATAIARQEVAIAGARLDEMGDKYGRVFALRFVAGYSESELAEELRMNVGTAKTRAHRARAAVRARLMDA